MARKDKKSASPPNKKQNLEPCGSKASGDASAQNSNPNPKENAEDRFSSMTQQLAVLGLKLRLVLGDGNCLFRALGDQLEGHTRNHLEYRKQTVKYMRENREFFEPFIEDTTTFNRHVSLLEEPGTHAGNDAIVAFAGTYKAVVVVHQLNTPLYHIGIHGRDDDPQAPQLHVAYHNGDHYDSVRKLEDPDYSEYPASIHIPSIIKNPKPSNPSSSAFSNPVAERGCEVELSGGNAFPVMFEIVDYHKPESLWGVNGSGRRIFGDETANLALTYPGASGNVGERCRREGRESRRRRRSALGAEARQSSGSDEERLEDVRNRLDKLQWNRYTSR